MRCVSPCVKEHTGKESSDLKSICEQDGVIEMNHDEAWKRV